MLKLRAPNDVRTNGAGAERRLVLESLRERVEWQACKDDLPHLPDICKCQPAFLGLKYIFKIISGRRSAPGYNAIDR